MRTNDEDYRAPLCKSCLHEKHCPQAKECGKQRCDQYRDKYDVKVVGIPTVDGWVMVC